MISSANKFIIRTANSKPLMVMCPYGFASLMRAYWMSCGYCICQRNGVNYFIPLTHTITAPILQNSL